MQDRPELVLPDRFEEVKRVLGDELATKLRILVEPVVDAERRLAIITQSIKNYSSGKVVFLLGPSGVGKSTFVESLTWRMFLSIPEMQSINASELGPSDGKLDNLYQRLQALATQQPRGRKGLLTVVIDYLEDFQGISDETVRAFFREVNGLLRTCPMLIIWPVLQREAVRRMTDLAQSVSTIVFTDEPVLEFRGPPLDKFADIARKTVQTLNPGHTLDDFQLTDGDLEGLRSELEQLHEPDRVIGAYLGRVRETWKERTGETQRILERIPKPTEVWFVVCYPKADDVVERFARKDRNPDLAWRVNVGKLEEYIGSGRMAATWTRQRLALAAAVFTLKVMFLPTHALVSSVAHFGQYRRKDDETKTIVPQALLVDVLDIVRDTRWHRRYQVLQFLERSALIRQLKAEEAKIGSRRGRSSSEDTAREAFARINRHISSAEGSDQPINRCLALAFREVLGLSDKEVMAEQVHPWLGNLRPDLLVTANLDKTICIEMHYTANERPYNLAYYILNKIDNYMKELEASLQQPRLRNLAGTG